MKDAMHRNIGTFEDNRIIHILGDGWFLYVKCLCDPNLDPPLEEVTDINSKVTCAECLTLMDRIKHIPLFDPERMLCGCSQLGPLREYPIGGRSRLVYNKSNT